MPVSPLLSHRTFPLIAAGLVAPTLSGVAGAARSNRNWSDNLAGPDSSNFVDLDEIKKSSVAQLEVARRPLGLRHVAAPQLITARHNGRRVDAVALAGQTNFLYVFDRVSGKPLWPIEERPVPKSEMPGEKAWPTQPWPTKPAPFGSMTFTVDDVNPWLATPEQYEAMKQRVAKARNEGPFTPPGLTDTISMPGNQGGANWGTTASNPEKGLVFVTGVNQVAILKLEDVRSQHRRDQVAGSQRRPPADNGRGRAVEHRWCRRALRHRRHQRRTGLSRRR
jgi:hypothetical protein